MKLSLKAKSWISIALFIAVFGGIITAATFYDLQISRLLTAGALAPGDYLAHDVFGVAGEIIGTSPVFLLSAFASACLCVYILRFVKLKALKYTGAVLFAAGSVVTFYFFIQSIMKYILEHAGNKAFTDNAAVILAEVFIAMLFTVLLLISLNRANDSAVKKFAEFALVSLIILGVSSLLIEVLKGPVGRMRYRAMNSRAGQDMGGFENYTAWYVMNGQPSDGVIQAFVNAYGAGDPFRSFPSGHTASAGMSYALIMLPSLFKLKNKGAKFACWFAPIAFTGLVAASRIVVGAHFLSDVTFGGTISFVCAVIVKECFIDKFSHIKAMFAKNKPEILMEDADSSAVQL